eukprot:scaffold48_cov311-Pinguiococcus_pyrenoidosus.AAC.129
MLSTTQACGALSPVRLSAQRPSASFPSFLSLLRAKTPQVQAAVVLDHDEIASRRRAVRCLRGLLREGAEASHAKRTETLRSILREALHAVGAQLRVQAGGAHQLRHFLQAPTADQPVHVVRMRPVRVGIDEAPRFRADVPLRAGDRPLDGDDLAVDAGGEDAALVAGGAQRQHVCRVLADGLRQRAHPAIPELHVAQGVPRHHRVVLEHQQRPDQGGLSAVVLHRQAEQIASRRHVIAANGAVGTAAEEPPSIRRPRRTQHPLGCRRHRGLEAEGLRVVLPGVHHAAEAQSVHVHLRENAAPAGAEEPLAAHAAPAEPRQLRALGAGHSGQEAPLLHHAVHLHGAVPPQCRHQGAVLAACEAADRLRHDSCKAAAPHDPFEEGLATATAHGEWSLRRQSGCKGVCKMAIKMDEIS